MNTGASIQEAYDPSRAAAHARMVVEEVTNGIEGDFGEREHYLMQREDTGQFHATYHTKMSPGAGMCYKADQCGYEAPFGVPHCNVDRPYDTDMNEVKESDHEQLDNVMGLSKAASASDTRSFSASMCKRAVYNVHGDCPTGKMASHAMVKKSDGTPKKERDTDTSTVTTPVLIMAVVAAGVLAYAYSR